MAPNRLRRTVVVCLMLLGLLAAAAQARAADFYVDLDRDGVRDMIRIESASGLLVWLSQSKVVLKLPTRRPILRVAAGDVDGDGHIELLAADTAAKLHVWHRTRGGKLRPTLPRHAPVLPGFTSNRRVHQTSSDPSSAATDDDPVTSPLDAPHPARLPSFDTSSTLTTARDLPSGSLRLPPHQPRAPPAV
jgi:hypothetical protein